MGDAERLRPRNIGSKLAICSQYKRNAGHAEVHPHDRRSLIAVEKALPGELRRAREVHDHHARNTQGKPQKHHRIQMVAKDER